MNNKDRNDDVISNAHIIQGILAGGGVITLALLTWIGSNVASIPVIEEQLKTVVTQNIDHETRIRALENKIGH